MADVTGMESRMDGGYEPPILVEPVGGPIPEPDNDDSEDVVEE